MNQGAWPSDSPFKPKKFRIDWDGFVSLNFFYGLEQESYIKLCKS